MLDEQQAGWRRGTHPKQQCCPVCGGMGHKARSHTKGNRNKCLICGQIGHNKQYHGERATNLREQLEVYPVVKGKKRCIVCHEVGHNSRYHDEKPTPIRINSGQYHCSLCGEAGHNRTSHPTAEKVHGGDGRLCVRCQRTLPSDCFRVSKVVDKLGRIYSKFASLCFECVEEAEDKRDVQYPELTPLERMFSHRLVGASKRARVKNIPFEVDMPFLLDLFRRQNGRCAYSGLPLEITSGSTSLSIDRRDSTKGYTPDNVALVCSVINSIKNSLSEESFFALCRTVAENNIGI